MERLNSSQMIHRAKCKNPERLMLESVLATLSAPEMQIPSHRSPAHATPKPSYADRHNPPTATQEDSRGSSADA